MKPPSFGSKELCRCLLSLGFTQKPQTATDHIKYKPPSWVKLNPGDRSYIMVQMGRKIFDPHSSTRYIRQIMNFGIEKNKIISNLK